MNSKKMLIAAAAVALASFVASSVEAAVWDGTGGVAITMPTLVEYFGPGPQTFDTITWTSTNSSLHGGSVFGRTGGYNFGPNPFWSGTPMAGLNTSSDFAFGRVDSMTFTFLNPVKAFGGDLNWVTSFDAPVTFAAYDAGHNLLESITLSASGDDLQTADAFYGFIRNTADIKSIVLTDGFIGIRNLSAIGVSAAPEPASWAIMLLGLGGLGATLRSVRRRSAVAA